MLNEIYTQKKKKKKSDFQLLLRRLMFFLQELHDFQSCVVTNYVIGRRFMLCFVHVGALAVTNPKLEIKSAAINQIP